MFRLKFSYCIIRVYAVTLTDTTVTVAQANTAGAFTDGVLTATIAADTATNLNTALAGAGNLVGTTDMITMTVNDAAGASVDATHLSAIGAKTAATVTVSNAVKVEGTVAEVTAALVTAGTKVTAATADVVFDDNTTTISATDLNAIDAATSGTITEATSNNFTITGLTGKTVAATGAADTFTFVTTDTSVTITGFVLGTDKIDFAKAGTYTVGAAGIAADALITTGVTATAYVFADGSNGTGTAAITDYTNMSQVVAFLEAGITADDAHVYGAVINDLVNNKAYLYEINVDAVATAADTIELGDVTLVGSVALTTDAPILASDFIA